ncbi:putative serine/threonine-protein kinase PknB [Leucoagaricus sp. SymC.cos]|nr:putative serine/threonine-protein kinase PknB [Leucoagaricus sp. SymC.cos]
MVSLCEESKSYPTCLTLNGVVRESRPRAPASFGEVWKATLGECPVCLKVARVYINTDTEGFISAFAKDAIKWRQLVHPNILPFYSVYLLEKQLGSGICLVSPWMVKGNVLDYPKLDPETSRAPLVIDMLERLDYLHRLGIVHGNIKPTNVLIPSSGSACLAEFDLKGSWDNLPALRWQAPELLGSETDESQVLEPPKKSDMYSIICVMYEILTGRIPYHEVLRDAMVILELMSGAQPSKPSSFDSSELTNETWEVMEQCFKRDLEQRLSINGVLEKLRDRWTNPLTLRRLIAWVRRQRQDDGGSQKTISVGEFDKAACGTVSSSRLPTADVELLRD